MRAQTVLGPRLGSGSPTATGRRGGQPIRLVGCCFDAGDAPCVRAAEESRCWSVGAERTREGGCSGRRASEGDERAEAVDGLAWEVAGARRVRCGVLHESESLFLGGWPRY